ncbi:aldo/keto reductase [Pseudokineococcus marinus]|uniref:Aldo/keto reductase n=1 Tax=Pseudokineococcus marinus TaxID=351215 RepID=A0A849BNJ1_9ACTN|nr:aldo/keto reductase [Pseudokineococcus marinus]NNH22382.1 aldo/keto reductase [Pseudokineococcus marinus]
MSTAGTATAQQGVDPRDVPTRTLRTGARIPAIGMGTFGSDTYGPQQVAEAVRGALRAGYRLVDCASVYGNEEAVGAVLGEALTGGSVGRDDLFVMTKVWNDAHDPRDAVASVRRSLADLRLDVLDAVFVHWPFPNHHPPMADLDARDPHAQPYDHERYMRLWRALEDLVDDGVVRHLGTSNMTVPKLRLLLRDARVLPALNEMEMHPCFQQRELFRFCVENGVQPVGYSPLGSPSRPQRDRTEDDPVDVEHPVVRAVAERHGVHPVAMCLKWAVAHGQIPIPFSVKPSQYTANLTAVTGDPLTPEEVEELRAADTGSRLIKGQVFLWPEARSWEDLWDVEGTVTGGTSLDAPPAGGPRC